MHFLSKKKSVINSGLITDFFLVCWMNLGHYQPLGLAADNNDYGENENKANKVDDGGDMNHGSNINSLIFREI